MPLPDSTTHQTPPKTALHYTMTPQQNRRAPKVILFLSTFIFPPLPIFLLEGATKALLVSLLLTLFGLHFLGVIYTLFYLWPYFADKAPGAGQTTVGENRGVPATEDVLERGETATTQQPQPGPAGSHYEDNEPAKEPQVKPEPGHPKHEDEREPVQGQSEEPPSYLDATADASSTTSLIVAAAAKNDHKIQR